MSLLGLEDGAVASKAWMNFPISRGRTVSCLQRFFVDFVLVNVGQYVIHMVGRL